VAEVAGMSQIEISCADPFGRDSGGSIMDVGGAPNRPSRIRSKSEDEIGASVRCVVLGRPSKFSAAGRLRRRLGPQGIVDPDHLRANRARA
jgi:hypothetical protein